MKSFAQIDREIDRLSARIALNPEYHYTEADIPTIKRKLVSAMVYGKSRYNEVKASIEAEGRN